MMRIHGRPEGVLPRMLRIHGEGFPKVLLNNDTQAQSEGFRGEPSYMGGSFNPSAMSPTQVPDDSTPYKGCSKV